MPITGATIFIGVGLFVAGAIWLLGAKRESRAETVPSDRPPRRITAIHVLLVVGVLEVVINRVAVPMLRPPSGVPPWWHTGLDYFGLFLFYFAGSLAAFVIFARCYSMFAE